MYVTAKLRQWKLLHNTQKTLQPLGALVDVLFVPLLEVEYGVVSSLLGEGVLVNGTFEEIFFRQTVCKLV
jgi:hypothetical protein